MTMGTKHVIRFNGFELDTQSGELSKCGQKLKLQGQPIQILGILLEKPGELITRKEIHERLWPADTFVDFEHSLNTAVKKLRQALGDEADTPTFIETLPRRGYRFIGEVIPDERGTAILDDAAFASSHIELARAESIQANWWQNRKLLGVAVACAVIALGIAALLIWRTPKRGAGKIESIAVLPLANFSGDAQQEFFADGMTEELITDLASIKALKVISRTSVMRYKGSKKTLPEIGRELGVDGIVEGSVQRSGDRVRVTAQLVHAGTDRHLWARTYERDVKDVLTLRDELARAIAEEIRIEITPEEKNRLSAPHTVVPEAYEAFIKGRHFADRFDTDGLTKGVEYFKQAVEKDPQYAMAWALLAHTLMLQEFQQEMPASDKALSAMKTAAQLAPDLAEAHVNYADVVFYQEWDWIDGETRYRHAVDEDPGSVYAREHYALCLWHQGRYKEALDEIERTRRLDPLSPGVNLTYATLLHDMQLYDRAVEQYRRTVELEPNYPVAWEALGELYEQMGRKDEAVQAYLKAIPSGGAENTDIAALQSLLRAGDLRAFWRKRLEAIQAGTGSNQVPPLLAARIYARLGEQDKALQLIEKAYRLHSPRMVWLNSRIMWGSLRPNPRFQQILRQLNLPKSESAI